LWQTFGRFENHFGREQRTPLARSGLVFRRATNEFVMASEIFYEPGGAKPRDGDRLKVERREREPTGSFYFHIPSMTEPVGHWLSKQKI